MNTDPVVIAEGLVKTFKGTKALDGLSLEIRPGIFGIIGPNGAGKTTLLRILIGLTKPDAGRASVLGLDSQRDSLAIRKRIGVLHEKPVYPRTIELSRYLEIIKGFYFNSLPVLETLSLVGLSQAAKHKIGTLSAGMYQRLGLAQALIGRPELVLLDEPTSNLDVTGRDDFIKMIVNIHAELGLTFVISSHILSELERACHQVAFIRNGRVIESGATWDVIQKHTVSRYRIVTSDPITLSRALERADGIRETTVTGANSVSVIVDMEVLETTKSYIYEIARNLGIQVHAFHRANTLEESFRDVMQHEN